MVYSMTGYGCNHFAVNGFSLTAEIKTLNHKTLDIHCRLPETFSALEVPLRRLLKKYISRGRADVIISLDIAKVGIIELNRAVYDSYRDILTEISTAGSPPPDPVALLALPNVVTGINPAFPAEALWPPLETALQRLSADRLREGTLLWQDIMAKIHAIEALVGDLTALALDQQNTIGERYRLRLAQLGEIEDSRILTEIAILVDKADINEELVRLQAHLAEFEKCGQEQGPVGRRLEFIGQELLREANTIAAKSAVYQVSQTAVAVKTLLEQVREQVQNIE